MASSSDLKAAPSKAAASAVSSRPLHIALAGNPNAGKTTLFNRLTGLRAKTANFPGTTLEIRCGAMPSASRPVELIDLPGLYTLSVTAAEERAALDGLLGRTAEYPPPDGLVILVDATHLERNLFLTSQLLEMGLPTIIALNMIDVAQRTGLEIDKEQLSRDLGCPVVPICARTGRGVDVLRAQMNELIEQKGAFASADEPKEKLAPFCKFFGDETHRFEWAEGVVNRCIVRHPQVSSSLSEAFDRILTHPVLGLVVYGSVMALVFYLIFAVASWPMDLIEGVFASLGEWLAVRLPAGPLQSLLVDGVVAGVGGVLVFLPQIALIFFCLTLLEDSGYMARAALVMDRLMRKVGLPGKAFVPLLSAHACAIPGIMATRIIDNKRDRLVTILVIPLLSCSARLPVYAMVAALLFPGQPVREAGLFLGAYGLGLVAAVGVAMTLRHTILPGKTAPLIIELPDYRRPGLRQALMTTFERAMIFVKKAGTTILAISIVLWWLSSYPRLQPTEWEPQVRVQIEQLETKAVALAAQGEAEAAQAAADQAANLQARHELSHSFAGRIGHFVEPIIRPLGFDWQIGVGLFSSLAAREMIVSTLSILYGLGSESDDESALVGRMKTATRNDGSPLFTVPTALSLMVFFVLAMQCLATQIVTKRETGQWRWAFLQFGYMSVLAWVASFITYQGLSLLGF